MRADNETAWDHYCLAAMEMTAEASDTPPILASNDNSPAGTSGISTFNCSRPTKPGARPSN